MAQLGCLCPTTDEKSVSSAFHRIRSVCGNDAYDKIKHIFQERHLSDKTKWSTLLLRRRHVFRKHSREMKYKFTRRHRADQARFQRRFPDIPFDSDDEFTWSSVTAQRLRRSHLVTNMCVIFWFLKHLTHTLSQESTTCGAQTGRGISASNVVS